MAIEVCPRCNCQFAVGLLRCPQCGETAPLFANQPNEEDPMARITVADGPSNADAQPGEPGYIEPAAQPEPAMVPAAPVIEQAPPVIAEPAPAPAPQPEANLADPAEAAPAVDTTSGKATGK